MSEHPPRNFRTNRLSRVATALCFALAVAVGTAHGSKDAFANSPPVLPDDSPADHAAVRDLEASLVALSDEVSGNLDARVEAKTDTIAEQATAQQTAALLQRNLDHRNPIVNHADRRPIATFVIWAGREVHGQDGPRALPASLP